MSANLWISSHCNKWLYSAKELENIQKKDQNLSKEEMDHFYFYFNELISVVGKEINTRQKVISTAKIFFRRFYVRNTPTSYDPWIVAPTCLYLSCKTEEMRIKARILRNAVFAFACDWPYTCKDLFNCEKYLIKSLDFSLIVFHPYRPLLHYSKEINFPTEHIEIATAVANDCYHTDLYLQFPPYLIAIACLYITCVKNRIDPLKWIADLSVSIDEVAFITSKILKFYKKSEEFSKTNQIIDKILEKLSK
ncbi:cyclin-c [Anaeramoeba flamelloides]|uniref:Cyclin-c n=1 Tax=Anaeramoeba flamelloides TaxID=1746091 RepID=A0ABQ8XST5_9EUKA|nr:cyclin-c [Anaeramoeba flamelloides]